jgi:hypothetical protein
MLRVHTFSPAAVAAADAELRTGLGDGGKPRKADASRAPQVDEKHLSRPRTGPERRDLERGEGGGRRVRVHLINTLSPLQTTEGGFALERADFDADVTEVGERRIVARAGRRQRHPRIGTRCRARWACREPNGNTNLIHAKTLLPHLRGHIAAGEALLITAAMALPNRRDPWSATRACRVSELDDLFQAQGCRIPVFDLASPI